MHSLPRQGACNTAPSALSTGLPAATYQMMHSSYTETASVWTSLMGEIPVHSNDASLLMYVLKVFLEGNLYLVIPIFQSPIVRNVTPCACQCNIIQRYTHASTTACELGKRCGSINGPYQWTLSMDLITRQHIDSCSDEPAVQLLGKHEVIIWNCCD